MIAYLMFYKNKALKKGFIVFLKGLLLKLFNKKLFNKKLFDNNLF